LLHERFGLEPQVERLPIGDSLEATSADAVLLIGDRAIHSPLGSFAEVWDLGDEWCRWAELPFVFAVWATRAGVDLRGLDTVLAEARDLGVANLAEIAAREAAPLGLTQPECHAYLRDNLYFHLGPREARGLSLFYQLASRIGLAPQGVELAISHCTTT
jgi:chorismate dehydratase